MTASASSYGGTPARETAPHKQKGRPDEPDGLSQPWAILGSNQ